MLMKYMRGAEAISIFKPTDTPLHFILSWLVGAVCWGAARCCREEWADLFVFCLQSRLHLNQTVKTSVWLRLRGKGGIGFCLLGRVKMQFMTAAKQSWATAFPLCGYICLNSKSPYSTSKKCVIQALASSSENINDSLTRWLQGAHNALWALQERRSVCSASRASWQQGADSWHHSQPL